MDNKGFGFFAAAIKAVEEFLCLSLSYFFITCGIFFPLFNPSTVEDPDRIMKHVVECGLDAWTGPWEVSCNCVGDMELAISSENIFCLVRVRF